MVVKNILIGFCFILTCLIFSFKINPPIMQGSDKINFKLELFKKDGKHFSNLVIENNTKELLCLSNPKFWMNSYPIITLGERSLHPFIKIKANVNNLNNVVKVKPNDKYKVTYLYSLEDLYQLEPETVYNVFFSYRGQIFNKDSAELTTNIVEIKF
jgi:hypothetical protein